MLRVIRYLLIPVFLMTVKSVFSQQIFTTEVGFHGGESYFIGDVRTQLKDIKPDYGFTVRHLFNQRLSLQADFNHTSINGSFEQHYDSLFTSGASLDKKINMLDFSFVFNFLDYGQLDHVLKSSNYSAYLFRIGFKVKLSKRLHLNMQWTHRLMLYDRLEGQDYLENPLGLNGNNNFNNDQAGTVTIGLSYGLFQRNCKCLNYK